MAGSDIVSKSYAWRDFDGNKRSLTFDIPRSEITASEKEFGADPGDVGSRVIKYTAVYRYTSKDAKNPKRMAEIKRKARADLEKQKAKERKVYEARVRSRGFAFDDEKTMSVDISAVLRMNQSRMAVYVRQFAETVGDDADIVRAALAFVQRMPYKTPPDNRAGRYIAGFLPPLETLAAGYGDCDTKSALFAALAGSNSGPEIILLKGPDHMLAAVEWDEETPGCVIKAFGKQFLVCECSKETWLPGEVSKSTQQQIMDGKFKAVRLK